MFAQRQGGFERWKSSFDHSEVVVVSVRYEAVDISRIEVFHGDTPFFTPSKQGNCKLLIRAWQQETTCQKNSPRNWRGKSA
jgi:hypothetical protein